MSVFGSIMNRIFGRASARSASDQSAAEAAPAIGGAAGAPGGATPASGASPAVATAPAMAGAEPPPAAQAAEPVDVEAVLSDLASKNPQTLNWRTSIVDLMKLLDLDSGLAQRRELARELGYSGSTEDTATMNVWLHRQVMAKLAENGGKVPDSLRG